MRSAHFLAVACRYESPFLRLVARQRRKAGVNTSETWSGLQFGGGSSSAEIEWSRCSLTAAAPRRSGAITLHTTPASLARAHPRCGSSSWKSVKARYLRSWEEATCVPGWRESLSGLVASGKVNASA